jgi:hypothetical protein
VLAARLFVFVEGPASTCPLGLDDFIATGLVVVFSTDIFHCAGQSLIIQSIYSLVIQYCISNHSFFGYLADCIHIWCLDALNLAIPFDFHRNAPHIGYVLLYLFQQHSEHCAIHLLIFVVLGLPEVFIIDCVALPTFIQKREIFVSYHPSKAMRIINQE